MHAIVGMPSPIVMTARHLAKRAPSPAYSASLSRRPSRPSVTFSPGKPAMGLAPLSTLMPGTIPLPERSLGKGVPSDADCRRVSSYMITPDMCFSAPAVVKRISLYARLCSSVDSTPIVSNLFLIVPVLSSAARMPLPGVTISLAVVSRVFTFMLPCLLAGLPACSRYQSERRSGGTASSLPVAPILAPR